MIVTLAIVLFASPAVSAFNEPEGFRGAKWGQSEAEVRAALGIEKRGAMDTDCYDVPADSKWIGDRTCRASHKVGDVPVKLTAVFRTDRLVRLSMTFRVTDFDQMQAAFIQRFGQAGSNRESVVKSGAGVEYRNRKLTWTGTW